MCFSLSSRLTPTSLSSSSTTRLRENLTLRVTMNLKHKSWNLSTKTFLQRRWDLKTHYNLWSLQEWFPSKCWSHSSSGSLRTSPTRWEFTFRDRSELEQWSRLQDWMRCLPNCLILNKNSKNPVLRFGSSACDSNQQIWWTRQSRYLKLERTGIGQKLIE